LELAAMEILTIVCLAAHLVCVNASSGLPLLGVWLRSMSRRSACARLDALAYWCGGMALGMLLAGALTGLLLAGVMWWAGDRGLFDLLPNFAYKLRWAIGEVIFYVVCMFGYLALLAGPLATRRWARGLQALLAVLASTNLLYHFPPLFAVMAQAASDPDLVSAAVGPSEFRELIVRGHVMALTVHFALASFAVSGVTVMYRLAREPATGDEGLVIERAARGGAIVALAATALQLLVGIWVLLTLDPFAQSRLLGGDWPGTACLAVGVLATFWLLHQLAACSFTRVTRSDARRIVAGLLVIILLMAAALSTAVPPGGGHGRV
jgi:hypothetical protein